MNRRDLLQLAGWLGFAPFFAGGMACTPDDAEPELLPEYEFTGEPGPADLFSHGVASGDPLASAVILWTRVSPTDPGPVDVFFEVAEDLEFSRRVAAGWFMTDSFRDFTVKVDVQGLQAGQTYHYRFHALGRTSAVGRTRTAPVGAVERVRLAVCSCASYRAGYYYGYQFIAQRQELDAVVHLGDYIYEGPGRLRSGERVHQPERICVSLEDYRQRYAQYRGDPDLQAVHQQHPFICVWDDHESANNAWREGAQGHREDEHGPWEERRLAAYRAWAEWIPVRESHDGRIFRAFRYGDLADLFMLDTRLWGRDEQAGSPLDREVVRDSERTLLGHDQEAWLEEQLIASTAHWKLVGQQVMFGHLKGQPGTNAEGGGDILNTDQWDGYWPARDRVLETLREHAIDNAIVLSGDIHSSWALDLALDPNNPEAYDSETGRGSLAVEMVAPGITSGIEFNPVTADLLARLARRNNPHIHWLEITRRGYIVLDLDEERARATWWLIEGVEDPEGGTEHEAAIFETRTGENHLVELLTPDDPLG